MKSVPVERFKVLVVSDPRETDNWQVVILADDTPPENYGVRVLAGCRNFTARQALSHWRWRRDRRALFAWVKETLEKAKNTGYRLHDKRGGAA